MSEFEVSFIKKLFKKYFNTKCISLREDFCASALISSEWVKTIRIIPPSQ